MERRLPGFGGAAGMNWRLLLFLPTFVTFVSAAERTPDDIKSSAYELYSRKQLQKSLADFRTYLEHRPGDIQAKIDYAGVLSEARRHADAARILEQVRAQHPGHESASFKLAVEYVYLNRVDDAARIFAELEKSSNRDLAEAAADAARKLETGLAREQRLAAEQNVFALANQFQHQKVVAAVDELDKTGPLTFALAMQRLYAMHSLRQYAPALGDANALAKLYPEAADLAALRADLLAQLGRQTEAVVLWQEIERNYPNTAAADQAVKRRGDTEAWLAADRVYELARQGKHREALVAIGEIERKAALPLPLELQRVHALVALGRQKEARQKLGELSEVHPNQPDLAAFRSALARSEPPPAPKPAALPASPPEAAIYALSNAERYREAVDAIDAMERTNRLSYAMQMQRLYALQSLRDSQRAREEALEMQHAFPDAPEVGLIRADLLIQYKEWEDASLVLKQIQRTHHGMPAGSEAARRLQAIPPLANLAKWYWGEAYNSGDNLGRFGTVVGSGFVRHGYFMPSVRRLQPYAELRYTVDTRSGRGRRSIIADNFVGGYLGARIQPFVNQYLFAYAQAGLNHDLLGRREQGDWAYDSQAGIYGFKSWGPGTVLLTTVFDETIRTSGNVSNPAADPGANEVADRPRGFWRGDWFIDGGADFSYYHRHSSWIGYAQAHEGFRLLQIGPHAAIDTYLVENVSWDVRGNYFDNLFEIGPGIRILWVPRRRWEVILRTEWLNGFYFGRDDLDTRGSADSHYDDFRVGLSVGTRW